jgi:hypothetical protein
VTLSLRHQPRVAQLLLERITDFVEDPRYVRFRRICLFALVDIPVQIDEWNEDDTAFAWNEDAYRRIVAKGVDLYRPSKDGAFTREEKQSEKRAYNRKQGDPNIKRLFDIHMTDPRIGHPRHAGKIFPSF